MSAPQDTILSLRGFESIVTISNAKNSDVVDSNSEKYGLRNFNSCVDQPSVSMVALTESISMVATCTPGRTSRPSGISVAIYDSAQKKSVYVKHSRRLENGYNAVCLVPVSNGAVVLAVDGLGKLHYCNLASREDGIKKRLLDFKECALNDIHSLFFVNNLTTRVETLSTGTKGSNRNAQGPPLSDPSSPSRKKNRKRKNIGSPCSLVAQEMYVVASCLNAPHPSDAAPIVMYISSTDTTSQQWQCVASSKIPIDSSIVMMTCVTFLSREVCGTLFDTILSIMKCDVEASCGAGVVLMGFRDGSLKASIVHKQIDGTSVSLQTSQVAMLLAGNNQAPLLSLQLITPQLNCDTDSPLLICTREDGSINVLSSTFVHRHSAHCENRIISMQLAAYESSLDVRVTFIVIYDNGRSFLHRASFNVENGSITGWRDDRAQMPLPRGLSFSTSPVYETTSYTECLFAMSQCNGNVLLLKMNYDACRSFVRREVGLLPNDTKSPILVHLQSKDAKNITVQNSLEAKSKKELTIYESLMQKLESVAKDTNNQSIATAISSSMRVSEAMNEIRNATRVSSYIKDEFATLNLDSCKVTTKTALCKQVMKNWDFSAHVMHLSPASSSPVCYRRGRTADTGYTKVLYGGAVQSYASKDSEDDNLSDRSIHIPMDQIDSNMYGTLQMRYKYDKEACYPVKSMIPGESTVAVACQCSSLICSVPISKSGKSVDKA